MYVFFEYKQYVNGGTLMSLITTKGAKASLLAAAFTLLPAAANAADVLTLKADDYVGISF